MRTMCLFFSTFFLLFVVIQYPKGGRNVFGSKMVHEKKNTKSLCGSLIGHLLTSTPKVKLMFSVLILQTNE